MQTTLTPHTAARAAYPFTAAADLRLIITDQNQHTAETLADIIGDSGIIGTRDDAEDHPVGLYLEALMVQAGHPVTAHMLVSDRLLLMQGRTIITDTRLTGALLDLVDLIADMEPETHRLIRQGEHDER